MSIAASSPVFRADPYPFYASVRGSGVAFMAEGPLAVFDYALAAALLEDRRFAHWQLPAALAQSAFGLLMTRWLQLMDPSRHSVLRPLAVRLLSTPRIQHLETELRREAARRLPRAAGTWDVVSEFAQPLTLAAAATLLGVPDRDRDRFNAVVSGAGERLLHAASGDVATDADVVEVREFLAELVSLARGRDDAALDLPGCLHTATAGDGLTADDLVAFAVFFLFASHENMMNAISNAWVALMRDPRAHAALASSAWPTAWDELLRFDSPVQFVSLLARERVTVGDAVVEADEIVWVSVGSANRDPQRFSDPERLDLGRADNPHLSFGRGPLYCPGASLARLEGVIALSALATLDAPGLASDVLEWRDQPIVLRGLRALRVTHRGVAAPA